LRDDLRTFALDRITSLNILNENFIPKGISSEEELSGSFGIVVDGEPVEVILIFDKEVKPYVLRKKWHQSQKEKELKDGRVEMSFRVNGIEGIKQWIYRWIPNVEVVEPKKLKNILNHDLRETLKKHHAK
jgi:predicted DNA-binding transcriptional regulator YafY